MRLDITNLKASTAAQGSKRSRHDPVDRVTPTIFQYDFLALSRLAADVTALIHAIPSAHSPRRALDLGADKSPYRTVLVERGFDVETLDISADAGATHVGTAEETRLADASFDLVLCTQVLEHCDDPWAAAREIHRIVRRGGHVIATAPHVWFYHPHPKDHWRFTQEGLVRLFRSAGLTPVTLLSQGGTVLTAGQVTNFLLYGVAGRLGAPVYAAVNLVTAALDALVPNDLFVHNFALLAQRS
jgi:SAM-dependent methyltransferase